MSISAWLQLVGWRDREVALLVAGPVGQVGAGVGTRVPDPFLGVDEVVAALRVLVEADAVEDVELRLGAPVADVGDAGLGQVGLGLLGDVAGVARVALAGDRIDDVADQVQSRHLQDRIDCRAVRVGDQEHVALVDGLEAPDARTVEAHAVGEHVFLEPAERHAEVLPGAGEVNEAQVHHLDASRPCLLQHLGGARLGGTSYVYSHHAS
jgi:hypothetical protein